MRNTDLAAASHHRIGHHAVQTDAGERQRQASEERGEARDKTLLQQ